MAVHREHRDATEASRGVAEVWARRGEEDVELCVA